MWSNLRLRVHAVTVTCSLFFSDACVPGHAPRLLHSQHHWRSHLFFCSTSAHIHTHTPLHTTTRRASAMDTLISKYAHTSSSASFDTADSLGDNLAGWDAASQFALPTFDIPMVANVGLLHHEPSIAFTKEFLGRLQFVLSNIACSACGLFARSHRCLGREPHPYPTRNNHLGVQIPRRNCRCSRLACLRRILYRYAMEFASARKDLMNTIHWT